MAIFLNTPIIPISASCGQIVVNNLNVIASNLLATSGTLNASSASLYANQLFGASSAMATEIVMSQLGYKVSS